MKALLAVSTLALAVNAAAAGTNTKNEFPLKEREVAGTYNVSLLALSSSILGGGILGEMAIGGGLTGGLILGFDGGFGLGVRVENGFRGAHKTGIYTALMAGFDYTEKAPNTKWGYNCDRWAFGSTGTIGYQYLHETGVNVALGVGASVTAFDEDYCQSGAPAQFDIDLAPSVEFSLGYNFNY